MKLYTSQKNKGFTLIETMIAVFILALAMTSLLGLITNSLFAARYANNEITANYLIEDALDYIRNDRDTTAFQQVRTSGGWDNFLSKYGSPASKCFQIIGCQIEPVINSIVICPAHSGFGTLSCDIFNYDKNAAGKDFYTYLKPSGYVKSNFRRKITMATTSSNGTDELDITVTVEWLNGNLLRSKSSTASLLNWQQ